jgi:hypothetical protein
MEDFGIFYGHLVHFTFVWYVLFNLVYFTHFGILHQDKSGNSGDGFEQFINSYKFDGSLYLCNTFFWPFLDLTKQQLSFY